jgi:hypothetical protein
MKRKRLKGNMRRPSAGLDGPTRLSSKQPSRLRPKNSVRKRNVGAKRRRRDSDSRGSSLRKKKLPN